MQAIANQAAPPTFDNTIVAMEKSGELLGRVEPDLRPDVERADRRQDGQDPERGRAAARQAQRRHPPRSQAVRAGPRALRAARQARPRSGQQAPARALPPRLRARRRATCQTADQDTLRKLNEEESTLSTKYAELQLKEMNAGAVIVDDVKDLDGMSATDIAAAAAAATSRGPHRQVGDPAGQHHRTAGARVADQPCAAREDLSRVDRAWPATAATLDVTKLVARLAQLRAQRAGLLGFPNAAAFILDDQMAKTPKAALALLGADRHRRGQARRSKRRRRCRR